MRVLLYIVQTLFNQISEKKLLGQSTSRSFLLIPNICEFKATHALPRAKSTF